MLGGSCIISPAGEIIAKSYTLGDEIVSARCDLDMGNYIKNTVFNFGEYRQIEHYKIISEQTGIVPPAESRTEKKGKAISVEQGAAV